MIGVIIPDRQDRPLFLEQCLRMIEAQTQKPDFIALENDTPNSNDYDLTKRVRSGFEKLSAQGCDCVLVMENDDWYHTDYIKTMVENWKQARKPDIFGIGETTYYHIGKKEYRLLPHPARASLMNTLISCKAEIVWPEDNVVFLDLLLWKQLHGKTFIPKEKLSIGIKHGVGKTGGKGHTTMPFDNKDHDWNYLRSIVDPESFNFYQTRSASL